MNILFSLNKRVKHIHSLPFKVLWPKAMAAQFNMNRDEKKEERNKSKATDYPESFTSLPWLRGFNRDIESITSWAKSSHSGNSGFWLCNWYDPLMVILLWLLWNPSPLFFFHHCLSPPSAGAIFSPSQACHIRWSEESREIGIHPWNCHFL